MRTPIGVFDSGFGGLTILKELHEKLPDYDFIYLGDNARTPYGTKSFDVVYTYVKEAVNKLFSMDCPLVILACNTASAKALRNIQQKDLPLMPDPTKRVLGVIRPCAEIIGTLTRSKHIGILGTTGTINSNSYPIEIKKFFPEIQVSQLACPMWVHLVEHNEYNTESGRHFIKQKINDLKAKDDLIDTIILGCTHYPFLKNIIEEFVGPTIKVVAQGEIVSDSLVDYLSRHPEIDSRISKSNHTSYYTTEEATNFTEKASRFLQKKIQAEHLVL